MDIQCFGERDQCRSEDTESFVIDFSEAWILLTVVRCWATARLLRIDGQEIT